MIDFNFDLAMSHIKKRRIFKVEGYYGRLLGRFFSIDKPTEWVLNEIKNRFDDIPHYRVYEDSSLVYKKGKLFTEEVNVRTVKKYENRKIKNTRTKMEYENIEECMEMEGLSKQTILEYIRVRGTAAKFKFIS